jgi:hypothetical protein
LRIGAVKTWPPTCKFKKGSPLFFFR